MFAVVARYYVKEGAEGEVMAHMREMMAASSAEPGCRLYVAHQSTEEPRRIVIYEQYDDEAAFQEHLNAPHFSQIVKARIWPLLESRERDMLRPVSEVGGIG